MDKKRILSIDAFRGLTIAAMILVNFPGNGDNVYFQLRHTVWNGLSFTDLIAPFFLFIVGVSVVLAQSRRAEEGVPKKALYLKIITRALKIFGVGMFLNVLGIIDEFSFESLRWTGTLHRIAIVYLVCSLLFLHSSWRQQAVIGAAVLLGYWLAMTLVPTPGYGKVMLEPGANLAAFIDSKFLPGAMWQGTWDPEGILSTFPSIVTGITGLLAGALIVSGKSVENKVMLLFTAGLFTLAAGVAWSWVFPTNENLWTSSFVLVTSGLASMILGAGIYLVDIAGMHGPLTRFGIIYGSNAIAVYVLADILAIVFYGIRFGGLGLNDHFFNILTSAGAGPKMASMMYALAYVFINFIPALILFRKKILIKL